MSIYTFIIGYILIVSILVGHSFRKWKKVKASNPKMDSFNQVCDKNTEAGKELIDLLKKFQNTTLYVWKENDSVGFFSGFSSLGEWGKFHQIKTPSTYTEIPLCDTKPLDRKLTTEEVEALAHIANRDPMRSGAFCKCSACGYVGYAYGIPTSEGVTHPFCPNCELNNCLKEIPAPGNDTYPVSEKGLRGLNEWTDCDYAEFEVMVLLGLIDPVKSPFNSKSKHVFWSSNPMGDSVHKLLENFVQQGVLEMREEPSLQYRWNNNYKGSWE